MPKLRPLSATEVGRLLRDHGFAFMHQRGSHLIYRRQLPGGKWVAARLRMGTWKSASTRLQTWKKAYGNKKDTQQVAMW